MLATGKDGFAFLYNHAFANEKGSRDIV